MNRKIKRKMIKVVFTMIILCTMDFPAFAIDKGVAIEGFPSLRQEVRPFVPLNNQVVIDPLTNQLILLFPKQEKKQIKVKPGKPEVKTEKKVILKTFSETEIRTKNLTIKNRSR